MTDNLDSLPFNDEVDDEQSLQIVNALFTRPEQAEVFVNEFQATIVAAVLFAVLSCDFTQALIIKAGARSPTSSMAIRAAVFAVLFYLITKKIACN